jgi:hypothetical protein
MHSLKNFFFFWISIKGDQTYKPGYTITVRKQIKICYLFQEGEHW